MPTAAPQLPPPNALIVDDDPDILVEVAERLEAVGHRSSGVNSVTDARAALSQGGWDYLVLDLEIPITFGRPNRVENGLALLGEVNQQDGHLPVVVITAHGHDSSDLAAAVISAGKPLDFIRKPFPRPGHQQRTLEDAARKAAEVRQRQRAGGRSAPTVFTGGVLRFSPDQVELLGVPICGNEDSGLMRRILDVARQTRNGDDWKGHTADSLADQVGAAGGASVSSTIKTWRTRVVDMMLKRANQMLTESSVLVSGPGGYRFAPGITVEVIDAVLPPPPVAPDAVAAPILPEGLRWNERQVAIAARLVAGGTVRRKDLEAEFGVSEKTLKRDLATMKARNLATPWGSGNDHTWVAGPALQRPTR
jgi:CheY-like chemotaxis protein